MDRHVGSRLRLCRRARGFGQEELAKAIGLTSQMVQKYESGANRISASKLYAMAAVLKTPVAFFFDGLVAPEEGVSTRARTAEIDDMQTFLLSTEGPELAALFGGLSSARLRRCVLELLREMGTSPVDMDRADGGAAR